MASRDVPSIDEASASSLILLLRNDELSGALEHSILKKSIREKIAAVLVAKREESVQPLINLLNEIIKAPPMPCEKRPMDNSSKVRVLPQ